jgi:hypothetical protein
MVCVDFGSLDWTLFALWIGLVALIVVIFIIVLLILAHHPRQK